MIVQYQIWYEMWCVCEIKLPIYDIIVALQCFTLSNLMPNMMFYTTLFYAAQFKWCAAHSYAVQFNDVLLSHDEDSLYPPPSSVLCHSHFFGWESLKCCHTGRSHWPDVLDASPTVWLGKIGLQALCCVGLNLRVQCISWPLLFTRTLLLSVNLRSRSSQTHGLGEGTGFSQARWKFVNSDSDSRNYNCWYYHADRLSRILIQAARNFPVVSQSHVSRVTYRINTNCVKNCKSLTVTQIAPGYTTGHTAS